MLTLLSAAFIFDLWSVLPWQAALRGCRHHSRPSLAGQPHPLQTHQPVQPWIVKSFSTSSQTRARTQRKREGEQDMVVQLLSFVLVRRKQEHENMVFHMRRSPHALFLWDFCGRHVTRFCFLEAFHPLTTQAPRYGLPNLSSFCGCLSFLGAMRG